MASGSSKSSSPKKSQPRASPFMKSKSAKTAGASGGTSIFETLNQKPVTTTNPGTPTKSLQLKKADTTTKKPAPKKTSKPKNQTAKKDDTNNKRKRGEK